MSTRRRIAVILAALAILILLLACEQGPNPSETYCNQATTSAYGGSVRPAGCE